MTAGTLIDTGRLKLELARRERWAEYRSGYYARSGPGSLTSLIEVAGLRGRGGSGFPAHIKWRAVAEQEGVPVVVANGEEGEPGSAKDRYLLRRRPHMVLDGLLMARVELGADRAIVYLSDPASEQCVASAIAERPECADVEIFRVAPDYVAGEESAVVRAINEGDPRPTQKPPRPFERGVEGRPTLVQNVETLAYVAWLVRHGLPADGRHTFLSTITGSCATPGIYELEYGKKVSDALSAAGVDLASVRGLLMGGYFGGLMNRRILDVPLDYDKMREAGTGLGCAAFMVLGQDQCPVATVASVVRYFAKASSGQCGSCVKGSDAMAAALERVRDGRPEDDDLEKLERWSTMLRGRGACGLIDGAAHQVSVLFNDFPEEIERHGAGHSCRSCGGFDHDDWIRPNIDQLLPIEEDRNE